MHHSPHLRSPVTTLVPGSHKGRHYSLVLEEGECSWARPGGSPALACLDAGSSHPHSDSRVNHRCYLVVVCSPLFPVRDPRQAWETLQTLGSFLALKQGFTFILRGQVEGHLIWCQMEQQPLEANPWWDIHDDRLELILGMSQCLFLKHVTSGIAH